MSIDTSCEASAGILAFVELAGKLMTSLATMHSEASENRRSDLKLMCEELIKLRGLMDHVVKQPVDPKAHHQSINVLDLNRLAVLSIRDIDIVLEELKEMMTPDFGSSTEQERLQSPNNWASPLILSTLQHEKMKRLSETVSSHIHSIIRVDQVSNTIKSLSVETQRLRPEFESRADSLTQSLASLGAMLQRGSTNANWQGAKTVFSQQNMYEMQSILRQLTQSEDHMIAEKIVASLNYDSRPVRHDSVPQAHRDTFRWAFESRLAEWFLSGSSTFWISGKPGSGKSTFMKFISNHQQTKDLLGSWAGAKENLAIAAHFFWIAGTPIQKSWQGLFQSLLFDTFNKQPAVIELISPRRWNAAKEGKWQEATEPWSVTELGVALRSLATTPNFPLKLCFFIDGLDEYDSNHEELCNILHDMAQSPHIKMCLSSRPWPVFEQRFGTDPAKKMDIHELTRDDIRNFVHDQLQLAAGNEIRMTEEDKDEICREIASKADGVFLWAFFVTKTLREANARGDTFADLHHHLNGLPRDLEQLFRTMLESVDVSSHPKMAGILQAASHALEPLHIDLYAVLEKEFDTPKYAQSCQIQGMTYGQLSMQREQTARSVNDKTKGLLKVVHQRFEFLHRTVKDFVLTKDMGDYLKQKLPPSYNGYKAIATAYLGFLKTTSLDGSIVAGIVKLGQGRNSGIFTSHLNQALIYAAEAIKTDHSRESLSLLDDYDHSVEMMIRIGHVTVRGIAASGSNPKLLFREELLRHNLAPYITQKLRDDPDFLELLEDPPLYFALIPMSLSSGESPAPVPEVLEILLRMGENPNFTTKRTLSTEVTNSLSTQPSPWVLFAREIMSVFNMLSIACTFPAMRFNDSLDKNLFVLLLSHGADPNASLLPERPKGSHTVFSHFLKISVSKFLGSECYEGYLRTLRAFLRAGATLGIPAYEETATKSGDMGERNHGAQEEAAYGNLARDRPSELILTSFCTSLKGLFTSLSADPERTKFIQSVTAELISHCSGKREALEEISSTLSEGCPDQMMGALRSMIDGELMGVNRGLKRYRGSWDQDSLESAVKQSKQ
ncbi:hypothetical protein PFICI_00070 [Pestalotiopsis fici W106-1]|uniref:NACHT domain-containing protein n=1 Tax=Pestalotiopsis fici (strain W106-1 / CGMCC3.15140) TaxID=1229662 RepID=W3XLB4_PESFW|nr:uncharacterized protein PFICI_00070 [Pestalotiopsis fici W106-1]ETS86242.1 hypothetical protein PFICI_00070 [Pestalotiopsis fici W106-1]